MEKTPVKDKKEGEVSTLPSRWLSYNIRGTSG